jgi:phosphoribosylamine--glycine ligase
MLDLALRAQEAKHEVVYYINPNECHYHLVGKGLVKRTSDFKPWLTWADMTVLAGNDKYLKVIDRFRAEHPEKVIFGSNQVGASWELDRLVGMRVLESHGIKCPPTKLCHSYEEAVAYVKKRDDARLVSKPCGDADKSLSYCSKGPEDMLFMLSKWHKAGKIKDAFVLQDFIPGVEFAVGGFVGRDGFAGGWEENFEHKKLMPGEIGTTTGEMGTVLMFTKFSKLANQVLKPLEDELVKIGFLGDIDVNCIIDEHGTPWPLEFTTRFGYPALQIQLALMDGDPVTWMYDLANKGTKPEFKQDTISLGIAMALAPFPYEPAPLEMVTDFPIYGVTSFNKMKIHPYHLQKGRDTEWATAGQYALVVTGTSDTVTGAKENAMRTLKQLNIPGDVLYRNDIGDKLSKFIPELQRHGYAKSFKY